MKWHVKKFILLTDLNVVFVYVTACCWLGFLGCFFPLVCMFLLYL